MDTNLLNASARVALVALLHDLGKFAQRAKIEIPQDYLEAHFNLYCPFNKEGQYHSHQHAAYTGWAMDLLERRLPDLIQGDVSPFANRSDENKDITDSIINAAAAHHKPDTFLQWVVATADRVASGFERETFEQYNQAKENSESSREQKNHYQARLFSLLEQISLTSEKKDKNDYCYPLKPLSAKTIFPVIRQGYESSENSVAQKEYRALWDAFLQGLELIPLSHRQSWSLWLDHFDSLWQSYTSAIPSATAFGVKPEVSLYDHSKTTAAMATALWRWHHENEQTDEEAAKSLKNRETSWNIDKFLLIQGDFFGIQDFIFASGSETNKQAAKLLRGRSFQVSLFAELAALKVLQACDLPSTSQITNAAGKFLIVAPNTEKVQSAVKQVQAELNQWFVEHTYGLVGLGLAVLPASCNDFVGDKFKALITNLFQTLEKAKLQRLDLTDSTVSVQNVQYPNGVCKLNNRFPAEIKDKKEEITLSKMSADQIRIGENLVKKERLLVVDSNEKELYQNYKTQMLSLPIFGYNVIFTVSEEITGKFGGLAKHGSLYRCWDFSIPKNLDANVWQGYARRYVNAYIPQFNSEDHYSSTRYQINKNSEAVRIGDIKTFDYIACEDRLPKDSNLEEFKGQVALTTLKGDVDNLGTIFQKGLEKPTFAKMASLSRQMNLFFSLWLPVYCRNNAKNSYTVFAGGDDFFLIGSWYSMQILASSMQKAFKHYVAENTDIHFSAGLVMSKVGLPVIRLGDQAEEALSQAKEVTGKNAITIFNQSIPWWEWEKLQTLEQEITRLQQYYKLSSSYLYSLIQLAEQAGANDLEATMWRSYFYYRTARYATDKLPKEQRERVLAEIVASLGNKGIEQWKQKFKIPLFNHFYKQR